MQAGALGGTTTLLHGTSKKVAGPYDWTTQPSISISTLGEFDGPKSVVYQDELSNQTKYSLWLGGGVYVADSLYGPFSRLKGFSYPGRNPAPVFHNGAFYYTNSPSQTVW